ncbi:NTF2- export protein 2 [Desmophyllum pertusum]|uniref:NTF2- export protein 2 n=1 Tax=Desmophyllum pertusum TaxID=174260 RepID=A0A9X0CL51_9CNID|nr:NTF2- export protein 2 [Desmophyllum pertusum]
MAAKGGDLRNAIEQATQAGEEFSNVYYETCDKRRHLMSKLYSANTTIVWNGNLVKGGSEKVTEFFKQPPCHRNTHCIHWIASQCQIKQFLDKLQSWLWLKERSSQRTQGRKLFFSKLSVDC